MNQAAGPELAAAVCNAGGLGVIGGLHFTPSMLRQQIEVLKERLDDRALPFGVDLLLPLVASNARKTNTDYTKGQLPELINVIAQSGARLFVCAVGVPPAWAVDKLHANGVVCMVRRTSHCYRQPERGVFLTFAHCFLAHCSNPVPPLCSMHPCYLQH